MAYLARIAIYPIKSLDGVTVTEAPVLKSGALQHDREFAIFDQQGRFVNGKRNAKVHLLRSSFDLVAGTVALQVQGTNQQQVFQLHQQTEELEAWLRDYFGFPVKFVQNSLTGFPDDTNASGPTVISTGTLEAVASWFADISVEQIRLTYKSEY
nr:MOSC N-terminal beta barrel domain-containing protein [Chroococcidiopsis sp. CCMEE 29]